MNRNKPSKREEAQQDLQRYYEILPDCEVYEVREFFLNGIISLDRSLDKKFSNGGPWELYQMIEDCYYNYSDMASWCCVEREDFHDVLKGEFPDKKTLKKMYVGLKNYVNTN